MMEGGDGARVMFSSGPDNKGPRVAGLLVLAAALAAQGNVHAAAAVAGLYNALKHLAEAEILPAWPQPDTRVQGGGEMLSDAGRDGRPVEKQEEHTDVQVGMDAPGPTPLPHGHCRSALPSTHSGSAEVLIRCAAH